ncbi:hypothetical protein HELRODRAFT_189278 [Helobdella robusta]|uniref:non-specific serine/threonine protein kinase n=1 Tax=Helobdella robusta TaxID=6412 RepID=T1FQW8_HELRO|nr:hypothetical protein HELRODRAFT_189278 [Helobdella robusta]ESN96527.1 hypothetical protein HELRODRAFT_189278 [Helobdella robusta]
MITPFVEGWDFVQVLGEGAYGEVKLAVNRETKEAVAVKIVNLLKSENVENNIKKEICINKMLNHRNIIKFYGHRRDNNKEYLFLEYACGGELFDRIEPDVGMPQHVAQKYFRELIAGVEYLHSRGVAHRDIKPENLLLDADDVLKLSDFGLATLYRHNDKQRVLDTCCGTVPYLAPEVVARKQYYGEPVDVWSCGIVLVALLAGELPWDEPGYFCKEYQDWKDCKVMLNPWCKIDNLALSLIRRILIENPEKRMKLDGIKNHPWFLKNFKKDSLKRLGSPNFENQRSKKHCYDKSDSLAMSQPNSEVSFQGFSQEEGDEMGGRKQGSVEFEGKGISFSQPHKLENLLLGTQMLSTPGTSQTLIPRLVRRMTRFFVTTNVEDTINHLVQVLKLDKCRVMKNSTLQQLTALTVDKRRAPLVFKACVLDMAGSVLVDFRLSKGDGIEFKKYFLRARDRLHGVINKKVQFSMWTQLGLVVPTVENCPANNANQQNESETALENPQNQSETAINGGEKDGGQDVEKKFLNNVEGEAAAAAVDDDEEEDDDGSFSNKENIESANNGSLHDAEKTFPTNFKRTTTI